MQIHILEIIEYWYVHENGKQELRKQKSATAWVEKDQLFSACMEWIENKKNLLDEDLVFAANSIAQSEGISDWDKLVRIAALFNRFSKFAVENNIKRKYTQPKSTWIEISSMETKLRGSAFE